MKKKHLILAGLTTFATTTNFISQNNAGWNQNSEPINGTNNATF